MREGGLVAPIHVKLSSADGHVGPLGFAKFHLNRHRGLKRGHKGIKNFYFLVKRRHAGATPLTNSDNFQAFYAPKYRTPAFQISCGWRYRLRSYCWETARRSIRPNISVLPVEKLCVGSKMFPIFWMVSTSSITVQSLGKVAQSVPAVGA